MKIVQILNNTVHWITPYTALAQTEGRYAPDILFAEAPDAVHESWGYDGTKTGDERFIRPETPEGWAYDADTGTFYPTDPDIIESLKTPGQKQEEYVIELEDEVLELNYQMVLAENGITV